jgi:hypothetical protein
MTEFVGEAVSVDPVFEAQMAVARRVMATWRRVLRALAE